MHVLALFVVLTATLTAASPPMERSLAVRMALERRLNDCSSSSTEYTCACDCNSCPTGPPNSVCAGASIDSYNCLDEAEAVCGGANYIIVSN